MANTVRSTAPKPSPSDLELRIERRRAAAAAFGFMATVFGLLAAAMSDFADRGAMQLLEQQKPPAKNPEENTWKEAPPAA